MHGFKRPYMKWPGSTFPQQLRRLIYQQFIHQPVFQKGAAQTRAGLYLNFINFQLRQPGKQRNQVRPACCCRKRNAPGACCFQFRRHCHVPGSGNDRRCRVSQYPAVDRSSPTAVGNDAQGLPAWNLPIRSIRLMLPTLAAVQPDIHGGIVSQHGSDAGQDGRRTRSPFLHVAA